MCHPSQLRYYTPNHHRQGTGYTMHRGVTVLPFTKVQNACSFLPCHHDPGHILPSLALYTEKLGSMSNNINDGRTWGLHSGYSSKQLWASVRSLGTWSTQACRCFLSDSQATGVTQSSSICSISCSNLEPVCSLVWGHELLRRFVNKGLSYFP